MKEIHKFYPDQEEVRTVTPVKELKYIGTISVHKGHKLFKLDLKTFQIVEIPIVWEKKTIQRAGINVTVKRLKLEAVDGFLYASALNKKNAEKHFAKMLNF